MTQSEAEMTGAAAPAIPRAQPPRRRRAAGARAVAALILREMATTYGRSPGGYLWALLDPIAGLLVMTLIFTVMVQSPPLGESFALFYATGFLPFTIYNDIARLCGIKTDPPPQTVPEAELRLKDSYAGVQ